jgi:hypothetical protein
MFLGLLLHMAMSVWVFVSRRLFMAAAFNTTYISLLSKAALPSWVPLCHSVRVTIRGVLWGQWLTTCTPLTEDHSCTVCGPMQTVFSQVLTRFPLSMVGT